MLKLLPRLLVLLSIQATAFATPRMDFYATGLETLKIKETKRTYGLKFSYLIPCGVYERGILLTPTTSRSFKVGIVLEGTSVRCSGAPTLKTAEIKLQKNSSTSFSFLPHDPLRQKSVKLGYLEVLYPRTPKSKIGPNFLGAYYEDCLDGRSGGYFLNPKSGEIAPIFISKPIDDNATTCLKKRRLVTLPPLMLDNDNLSIIPYKSVAKGDGNRFNFSSELRLGKIKSAKIKAMKNKDYMKLQLSYYRAPCRELFLGALLNPLTLSEAHTGNTPKNQLGIGIVLITDKSQRKISCPRQRFTSTLIVPKIKVEHLDDLSISLINSGQPTQVHLASTPIEHNIHASSASVLYQKPANRNSQNLGIIITPRDEASGKYFTGIIYTNEKKEIFSDIRHTAGRQGQKKILSRQDSNFFNLEKNTFITFKTTNSSSPIYPLQLTSYASAQRDLDTRRN